MTDLELLSAYLDDELSPRERALVEARLQQEAEFKKLFGELKTIKTRIHALPTVKPPRAFTLKPEMVGLSSHRPSTLIPFFNFATAAVALLFAVVLSVDLFRPPLAAKEASFAAPQAAAMPVPSIAQDQAITRQPETVSKSATSLPSVAGGAAEAPKPVAPAAQGLAPGARAAETITPTVLAQAPAIQNVAPTLTATIIVPTHTATAVVTVAPVSVAAQESAASPWLWAEIILGGLLFIFIALSLIARTWK